MYFYRFVTFKSKPNNSKTLSHIRQQQKIEYQRHFMRLKTTSYEVQQNRTYSIFLLWRVIALQSAVTKKRSILCVSLRAEHLYLFCTCKCISVLCTILLDDPFIHTCLKSSAILFWDSHGKAVKHKPRFQARLLAAKIPSTKHTWKIIKCMFPLSQKHYDCCHVWIWK